MFFSGHFEDSLALVKKAIRLCPITRAWYPIVLIRSYNMLGRYEDAIPVAKQLHERCRRNECPPGWAQTILIQAYIGLGREEEARAEAEEILKIDRLAYLGEFSSTLAHEIRNPLAGIKTTAQALSEELGKDDLRREYIDRIIKEIDRLNELLRTFFSFAKPRRLDLIPRHIEDIIKEVKGVLAKEAEKMKVTIKEIYDDNLPPVPLDINQMQQVFMNLFLNAFEAMPVGGILTVEIDRGDSQEGWIQVKIKDTGNGIATEHLSKIFDPFFTTKSKGLGLGLAITHKIMEGHGGTIGVESTPGKGSKFILSLPIMTHGGN